MHDALTPQATSLVHPLSPLVVRVAELLPAGLNVWNAPERYEHERQVLEERTYFMGSPKRNTRCKKLTTLGADKKFNDDTTEKKQRCPLGARDGGAADSPGRRRGYGGAQR
jgi:hypothetical protein